MEENTLVKSKYIKPAREIKVFAFVAFIFFFVLFVLPQYFGIPFPLFDLTALRIMIVMVVFMIIADSQRKKDFVNLVAEAPYTKVLIPYLLVISYTMVLRVDINAFLNPFIELFSFFLLIYMIKNVFGIKKTVKYILLFAYILAILGLVEFVLGRSLFSYMETISGLYTGQFIRSGHYRIMGPCNHSLGYGLLLVTLVPFACLDMEKNEINVLKNKLLIVMLAANVFLNGSRSTLSVLVIELFLLVMFSPQIQKKRLILVGSVVLLVFAAYLVVCRNTEMGRYILLQITSIMDEVLGTELSVQFGANTAALSSSSNYRDQLKYIFQVDWLNPVLGLGRKRSFASEINGSYIHSVDNFYIAEYIRYAYPGMIAYVAFVLYFLVNMIKKGIREHSGLCKALFAGALCYCINLFWLDSLQTLKYLYVLFAVFAAMEDSFVHREKVTEEKYVSKYIKR